MKIMFQKKRFLGAKFLLIFLISIMVLIFVFLNIIQRFKPVFEEKTSHAAKNKAIEIINDATDSVFSNIVPKNLVTISHDENGKISSVTADTIEMNKLKTEISKSIHKYASNKESSSISIPIGSLTNFAVLQGVGYRIPVRIATDGFSKIDFEDEFINAGINQVKHKIYMIVTVNVSVISSVMTKSETITTEIPVAETVIAGTVPNYYGDNLSVLGR